MERDTHAHTHSDTHTNRHASKLQCTHSPPVSGTREITVLWCIFLAACFSARVRQCHPRGRQRWWVGWASREPPTFTNTTCTLTLTTPLCRVAMPPPCFFVCITCFSAPRKSRQCHPRGRQRWWVGQSRTTHFHEHSMYTHKK